MAPYFDQPEPASTAAGSVTDGPVAGTRLLEVTVENKGGRLYGRLADADDGDPGLVAMRDERGFSMIELMIAMLVSMLVLGSAASVISGGAEHLRAPDGRRHGGAGGPVRDGLDPPHHRAGGQQSLQRRRSASVPSAGTAVQAVRMDPDGDGLPDDIRIQADVGIPDGLLVGSDRQLHPGRRGRDHRTRPGRHNTITRFDRGTDAGPIAWTDGVFTGLQFQFLDSSMTLDGVLGRGAHRPRHHHRPVALGASRR